MVLDESSFDITRGARHQGAAGLRRHFRSFDGKARTFLVEGAGGPTWYTEYNVLSGLSARSYGRFADFVTRIAAGRVERGLPHALRRCGYKTFSLYPGWASSSAPATSRPRPASSISSTRKRLRHARRRARQFLLRPGARLIERERGTAPLFLFVYTMANHFPWNHRFRPELTPEWRDPGNAAEVDEYLRRQAMSERDYARIRRAAEARISRASRSCWCASAITSRHFAKQIIDPALDDAAIAQRIAHTIRATSPPITPSTPSISRRPTCPRRSTRSMRPICRWSCRRRPGLPLDPSFAEQKKILQRCHGLFYRCADGAEARRFNRLLIDAGLIKGL